MRKKSPLKKNQLLFCFYILLPIIILFAIIRFIPIVETLYYSFCKISLVGSSKFIGFKNYLTIISDKSLHEAFFNSIGFVFITVPSEIVLSLILALLLERKIKGGGLYETIYFIPVVVSMVSTALIWKWMYDPTYGAFNYLLSLFHIPPVGWLIYHTTTLISICIMTVWKDLGYNMVIFIVGLRAIDRSYYESASIDGANRWQAFTNITFPLLKPITLFVSVMAVIRSFMMFTQVFVLTGESQASPNYLLRVIVYDVYERAFTLFKIGSAATESIMLLFVVLAISYLQLKLAGGD